MNAPNIHLKHDQPELLILEQNIWAGYVQPTPPPFSSNNYLMLLSWKVRVLFGKVVFRIRRPTDRPRSEISNETNFWNKQIFVFILFYFKFTKAVIMQSKDAGKHVTSKLVNTTQQNEEKIDQRNCSKW